MFAKRTNWNLAPNRLSLALAEHRAAGKVLLDLTVSNPTECGFEYDGAAILQALRNLRALKYEPDAKGLPRARQAVAEYYAEKGAKVSADDIILTTSTSEAYSYAFRTLCDPGDEILIPSPSYPLFDFLAEIQDVRLMRYPQVYDHGWQIDFYSLERAITPRTRGVIVVHPNNPTGHFVKPAEMARLNAICSVRQLAIIADEVFLDYALENFAGGPSPAGASNQPASFAANADALTFTMSGLSKISGLPQMKAAWLTLSGPQPWKGEALARLEVIADTYLSMNAPVQHAIAVFLEQRHTFQRQLLSRVKENLAEFDRQLAAQKACTRLPVEGGWYVVLRVPATQTDEDLSVNLLTQGGVYVHHGDFYDFPSDGFLVVGLLTPVLVFSQGVVNLLRLLD